MGLFDIISRLLGRQQAPAYCPQCGAIYSWDGRPCRYCGYPDNAEGADNVITARKGTAAGKLLDGLNTDKFQPLTTGQAMDLVKQDPNFKSAYYDSLSEIPDENLPRIQVIDRTMVGLGLISPEELARIHKVGKEMGELTGTVRSFVKKVEEAVQRSRQDRQRIKERKIAEAKERREKRTREIEQRRQSDIVFLGRGVSKGLADRRSNVEKLQANSFPILSNPAEVARGLGLTVSKLRWLAFHSEASTTSHYITFCVPKKSGGVRQLAAPHRMMSAAQYWILENILNKLPVHDAAHGFVIGRSTVTNAEPHVGADVVVNADLSDFFSSITFYRVQGVFRSMGYSPAVATVLGLLCTECPRQKVDYAGETYHAAIGPRSLPQGACTSPAISNLISRRLDSRLNGIALKLKWNYTRYADDITFSASGEHAEKTGYVLARIRHICQDEGFAVNEKKTRILRGNTAQSVTGIVVNDRPGVPRRTVRRLRAILHRARFEGLERQNRDNHPHFESWLQGMIAYVNMVNPDQGRPLAEAYHDLMN